MMNNITPFNSIRRPLSKVAAICLFTSCISQLFIWCINPKQVDLYKYSLAIVSMSFMVLLFRNIWREYDKKGRKTLILRILCFTVVFNIVVVAVVNLGGGVIAFGAGVTLILACWRIASDENDT